MLHRISATKSNRRRSQHYRIIPMLNRRSLGHALKILCIFALCQRVFGMQRQAHKGGKNRLRTPASPWRPRSPSNSRSTYSTPSPNSTPPSTPGSHSAFVIPQGTQSKQSLVKRFVDYENIMRTQLATVNTVMKKMRIDGHEHKGNVMPGRKVRDTIHKLRDDNSKSLRKYFQKKKIQYQANRRRVDDLFEKLESTWKYLYKTWNQLYRVSHKSATAKIEDFEFLRDQSQMLRDVYSKKNIFLESVFPAFRS